jgi:hypothetical protein
MENRWSIYGGIREKQRSFLQGNPYVLGVKNQRKREKKNLTPPRKTKKILGLTRFISNYVQYLMLLSRTEITSVH